MAESRLLYYITDRTAFATDEPTRRRCLLEKIAEAARAGVDYIQLREKDLSTRKLESLAREAVQAEGEARKLAPGLMTPALLINSRTDIALSAGADGVHLRSDDISPQEVRTIWRKSLKEGRIQVGTAVLESLPLAQSTGPAAQSSAANTSPEPPMIGVSCHSLAEVRNAEENGASFAVFAPIFGKKDVPGIPPAGLSQLREACKASIPVLALGGVTLQNAKRCLDAGAAGIAAIRLFQENDIADVVRSLRQES